MNLRINEIIDRFFTRLRTAPRRVLLSDFDGTLAPFQVQRDSVQPYPGVTERLTAIRDAGTRLVLVTGRPVQDLAGLLGMQPPPEIWGAHGLERLHPDGRLAQYPLTVEQTVGLAQALEQAAELVPEGRLERKHGCLALHWRGMSPAEIQGLSQAVAGLWGEWAEDSHLTLRSFDGGLELRVPGRDKGSAVREVLAEEGVEAAAAYLGDDLTDEDAFRALQGKGLAALVRPESRPTAADIWLQAPDELILFLDRWLAAAGKP